MCEEDQAMCDQFYNELDVQEEKQDRVLIDSFYDVYDDYDQQRESDQFLEDQWRARNPPFSDVGKFIRKDGKTMGWIPGYLAGPGGATYVDAPPHVVDSFKKKTSALDSARASPTPEAMQSGRAPGAAAWDWEAK